MPYQGRLPYTYKSPFNTTLDQGTQTVPSLAFLGDTNNGLFSPATDNIAITTNGVERLRVTDTGRVGIGTTNPIQKLQVYDGSLNVYRPTGEVNIQLESGDTSVTAFRAISPYRNWRFGIQGGANADFVIRDATSSANRLGITSTGQVIIGQNLTPLVPTGTASQLLQVTGGAYVSGNVGIGTTNPATKLDVNGNIFPTTDATHDLGSPSKRWNNVYTTDLQLSNEGSSNDVDGTWGAYTIQEGENDLYLLNRRNGKKYKFVLQEVN